jgi:hypothetical protein
MLELEGRLHLFSNSQDARSNRNPTSHVVRFAPYHAGWLWRFGSRRGLPSPPESAEVPGLARAGVPLCIASSGHEGDSHRLWAYARAAGAAGRAAAAE